jgi:hypothetical protein
VVYFLPAGIVPAVNGWLGLRTVDAAGAGQPQPVTEAVS